MKLKLSLLLFKYSVPTSKKTQPISITRPQLVNAVYSQNHMKPINTFCGQNAELLTVKAGGTYSYDWALKG
jgi:hypothetical protein